VRIGEHDIHVVSDGNFRLDGGTMFGMVPKVLWERCVQPDELNRIPIGLNCLLIRSSGVNILVDTGIGRDWDAKKSEIYAVQRDRDLPSSLRRLGVEPEEIDIVILTHLHLDHTGWCTAKRGGRRVPFFPRARYIVQRGEWEEAIRPDERRKASYFPEHFEPLNEASVLELVDGDIEVAPGVRCFVTGGHTKYHQCVMVEGDGASLLYGAEILPTHHHLKPTWGMSYDDYPVEAARVKMELIERAIREKWLVVPGHDPEVPVMMLERDSNGKPVALPVDADIS